MNGKERKKKKRREFGALRSIMATSVTSSPHRHGRRRAAEDVKEKEKGQKEEATLKKRVCKLERGNPSGEPAASPAAVLNKSIFYANIVQASKQASKQPPRLRMDGGGGGGGGGERTRRSRRRRRERVNSRRSLKDLRRAAIIHSPHLRDGGGCCCCCCC